jgi:hypothetical protein
MKRKHSTETPVCPQKCLVIVSYTTGLSFALERIGPLAAITITVFYLLILYLSALSNTPENPFASIYSESLIKTACQHLLLLVGFDTLIYRKYYDTPSILVGHHGPVFCSSSHSAIKSGSTWDLIAFRFSYVMSRGDNLIPHKETRPVAAGLFNIFDNGVIGCTTKYYLNFHAVVNALYASFW